MRVFNHCIDYNRLFGTYLNLIICLACYRKRNGKLKVVK